MTGSLKESNHLMFQKFASTLFVAGLFVCANSSVGLSQEGGQPAAGSGVKPAQIKEAMDEGSMMEKASKIFGYNAAGRMVQGMERMGVTPDAAGIVEVPKWRLKTKSCRSAPK